MCQCVIKQFNERGFYGRLQFLLDMDVCSHCVFVFVFYSVGDCSCLNVVGVIVTRLIITHIGVQYAQTLILTTLLNMQTLFPNITTSLKGDKAMKKITLINAMNNLLLAVRASEFMDLFQKHSLSGEFDTADHYYMQAQKIYILINRSR